MKFLITGGAGFIGSNLARKLLSQGHSVVILDNLSPQVHGKNAKFPKELTQNCECFEGDIRDEDLLVRIIPSVEGVLHMVSETGMGQSMYQVEKYADVNVRGTGILLDVLARLGKNSCEKILIPSTSRVYGEGLYRCENHGEFYPNSRSREDLEKGIFSHRCTFCGDNMTPVKNREAQKPIPTSIYGVTKLAQEQMVAVFCHAHKIPVSILRYQNVYGPGQSLLNPYTGVLNVFAQQIQNGVTPEIYEQGHPIRDFINIEDVVSCTLKAFFSENLVEKILNVGYGEVVSIVQVAEIMMNKMGMEGSPQTCKKYRVGDVLHGCADMDLTNKTLNWSGQINIEQGVGSFVDYLKDEKLIVDRSGFAEEKLFDVGLMGGR
jgi:dTDP-L-rhamnose 4-epimerase